MKKYVLIVLAMMLSIATMTCDAKGSSFSSSSSRSSSFSSSSSSRSYSFSSSPSKSYSSSSSSSSSKSSSFFGGSESSKPKSYLSYESKRNDSLIQKGDSGATYRRMDKQMADAGIKKKESVTQVERAFSPPSPKPPVVPVAPSANASVGSNSNRGYAYTTPAPVQRTQVIERHHYHNNDSGPGFVSGMVVGSMLSHNNRETVIINNGTANSNGSVVRENVTQTPQCTVYDNDCITQKFHFVKSVDF